VNAAAQVDDPDSVFNHHRRLIELRHQEPVVVHGSYTRPLPDSEHVHGYLRSLDGRELLVVVNLSGGDGLEAAIPDASAWASAELVLTNAAEPSEIDRIVLGPWEARVYRRG
ncbi:MAG: DUF3459 domain-containing protein, partial [Nocardioides sp.]